MHLFKTVISVLTHLLHPLMCLTYFLRNAYHCFNDSVLYTTLWILWIEKQYRVVINKTTKSVTIILNHTITYLSEFICHKEGRCICFWLHVSNMRCSWRIDVIVWEHLVKIKIRGGNHSSEYNKFRKFFFFLKKKVLWNTTTVGWARLRKLEIDAHTVINSTAGSGGQKKLVPLHHNQPDSVTQSIKIWKNSKSTPTSSLLMEASVFLPELLMVATGLTAHDYTMTEYEQGSREVPHPLNPLD